jgi:hypothetical protein
MRLLAIVFICAVPILSRGYQTLASKVIRIPLNQSEPAIVKLGTHGITTLEFPDKIEALDGFGFSVSPSADGADLFQISFNKGTNFLSLKALREGVEGNLTVVLGGKVYSLFCRAVEDPSFVVVFEDKSALTISNPHDVLAQNKQVSPARLLGFLDKVKAYPSLKISAPEIYRNMEVGEPNSESSIDGLKLTLRRVIRDGSLDCLGFDVELVNQSEKDFLYDPESFGVRVGEEVYPETVSDAGGIVDAGKTMPAFFVVAGTATGSRNDLAVTNKFDIVLQQILGKGDSNVSKPRRETPIALPTGQKDSPEPALPDTENSDRTLGRLNVAEDKKLRKNHGPRRKSAVPSKNNYAAQSNKKERDEERTAEDDE